MTDIYDIGKPKYAFARGIYDALNELVQTEEMDILSEIGVNVSYENQTYYYTDEGNKLKCKFEELSGWGEKMWLIDLAIYQLNFTMDIDYEYYEKNRDYIPDIHDIIPEALSYPGMARRIGFKRLFIDKMLNGEGKLYPMVSEEYENELRELDRFGYADNRGAFYRAMKARGEIVDAYELYGRYGQFSGLLHEKIMGCNFAPEKQLVAECRALLSAYDDFIIGLRANQALYEEQERMFRCRMAELEAGYDAKVKWLLQTAERQGVDLPGMPGHVPPLELEAPTEAIENGRGAGK